ncbi:hypothetical protein H696_06104 [Fonticula alba]|uniref:Uncharacterized protein n=1 Tax=Fonticula alba TaxID=691883 RepID=A0A058YZT1_FONAL|nr:hypothetical protein H696_06104 [Fonticula alba]KCV67465.1 hypothetical protein H696_06104 [Fonticula alba]|eukprot:XP_009498141.1 hypothetical protein H696_06104 [Fonticula alba]
MLKASFLLAFLALLAVASGAPVADSLVVPRVGLAGVQKPGHYSTKTLKALANATLNPCEYELLSFQRSIEDMDNACSVWALEKAASLGKCNVESANTHLGKTVDITRAHEDCAQVIKSHKAWCRETQPDSEAANYDLSEFECPTRYQTSPNNKSFPRKGCDNVGLGKIYASIEKHCEPGDFLGVTLDSLCFNKKCASALGDLYVCARDRFAAVSDFCVMTSHTYSFEVFCPTSSPGYKIISALDCSKVDYVYNPDKDYAPVREN